MMHKIELRDKRKEEDRNGQPTVGANCEILIDGKLLKGVTNFKVEVNPRNVANITIEMIGELSIDIIGDYETNFFSVKNKKEE